MVFTSFLAQEHAAAPICTPAPFHRPLQLG
jgi:hypothetical protein